MRICERFAFTLPPEAMARLFAATPGNDLPRGDSFSVCPTRPVAVCPMRVVRRLRAMRWGFVPHWYKTPADGPRLIHARAGTVADTPAFRAAAGQRRCLVAADGHCEWTREAGQVPGPGEAGIARADAAMSRGRCPGLPRPHAQERADADSGRKHAKIRFRLLPPGSPGWPRKAGEAKSAPEGAS